MKLIDRLERKFGHWSIPNLTMMIVFGQVVGFILGSFDPQIISPWYLRADLVIQGEIWRLLTFPMIPPSFHFLVLFGIYLFYLMGTALEHQWGTFRYNIYLLIGYLSTIAVAFLLPGQNGTVSFIGGSVFLAFAWLFPNFELMLMFILPIKIKYLALLQWIFMALAMISGSMWTRLYIIASVLNFLLFFGAEVFYRMRSGKRRMERHVQQKKAAAQPFHECTVCGVTDKIDRHMEFRYCSSCEGSHEYCMAHLKDHHHIGEADAETTTG